jgi:hypothetical protein
MAQQERRLKLAKQTLRPLGDQELGEARGGITTTSIVLSCATIECDPTTESTGTWSCGKIGVCC